MLFATGSRLHGAAAQYIYSNTTGLAAGLNATISKVLTSYFVSFVIHLDPNPLRLSTAPFWPPYRAGGHGTVVTGESVGFSILEITDTTIGVTADPDVNPECDFFSGRGNDIGI